MDKNLFHSYYVEDRSYISYIKREIHNLIKPSFDSIRTGEIDIIVSEMATNLIKHASSGELLYRLTHEDQEPVFEIICIDNGPGIKDVSHSAKDGISSKNTLGHGIGAIMRLSSMSQIYSLPEWGTVLYSKCYASSEKVKTDHQVLIRSLQVAKPGETVSGDGAAFKLYKTKTIVFLGDGLGHGEHANNASSTAIESLQASMSADASEIIREMHNAVKRTRGLVGTVAVLDHQAKQWNICGVGNIATRLQRGIEWKNYICNNGIIGLNIPSRLDNCIMEMEKFQYLILCSDGIKTRWDFLSYPSILKYDPMVLAAVIYKDHARKTDDMSIMIVKVI